MRTLGIMMIVAAVLAFVVAIVVIAGPLEAAKLFGGIIAGTAWLLTAMYFIDRGRA